MAEPLHRPSSDFLLGLTPLPSSLVVVNHRGRKLTLCWCCGGTTGAVGAEDEAVGVVEGPPTVAVPAAVAVAADDDVANKGGRGGNRRSFPVMMLLLLLLLPWGWCSSLLLPSSLRALTRRPNKAAAVARRNAAIPAAFRRLLLPKMESLWPPKDPTTGATSAVPPTATVADAAPEKARTAGIVADEPAEGKRMPREPEDHRRGTLLAQAWLSRRGAVNSLRRARMAPTALQGLLIFCELLVVLWLQCLLVCFHRLHTPDRIVTWCFGKTRHEVSAADKRSCAILGQLSYPAK